MRGAKQKEIFEISDLRRRETLHLRSVCPPWGGGGGGGSLIFSYIRRFRLFLYFWGFKISNFNIFVVFQKTEYF